MISFGNAASSHSGLIPLKTAYKKRGELLWAIASKKNFINLHSAAFVTVFARNLVHAYKFHIIQKTLDKFCLYAWQSRDQLSVNIPCKFQKKWKQGRLLNRASNMTNFPTRFCVYKWASHYSLALFSSFKCTCTTSKKNTFASKRTLDYFPKKGPEYGQGTKGGPGEGERPGD